MLHPRWILPAGLFLALAFVADASDDSAALVWDINKVARPAAAKALQPGDLEQR